VLSSSTSPDPSMPYTDEDATTTEGEIHGECIRSSVLDDRITGGALSAAAGGEYTAYPEKVVRSFGINRREVRVACA
jgi:hypothetical protein